MPRLLLLPFADTRAAAAAMPLRLIDIYAAADLRFA